MSLSVPKHWWVGHRRSTTTMKRYAFWSKFAKTCPQTRGCLWRVCGKTVCCLGRAWCVWGGFPPFRRCRAQKNSNQPHTPKAAPALQPTSQGTCKRAPPVELAPLRHAGHKLVGAAPNRPKPVGNRPKHDNTFWGVLCNSWQTGLLLGRVFGNVWGTCWARVWQSLGGTFGKCLASATMPVVVPTN